MNDDDVERRLRRALKSAAETAVPEDAAFSSRAHGPSRRHLHVVPAVAAAALIVTISGGSAALVAFTDRHPHHQVDSESKHLSATYPTTATEVPSLPPVESTPGHPRPRSHHTTAPAPQSSTSSHRWTSTSQPAPPSTVPTSSEPSSTPSSTPASSTPSSTATTSVPPSTPSTTAGPGPGASCTSAHLSLEIGGDRMVGTKGGDYTFMEIVNNGQTCTLDGYPTVEIFNGSGVRIGGPASHRSSPAPQKVVLARGAAAEIELYDWNDSAPDCTANYAVGRTLQFTPPGQSTPITIDYGYSACQLSVSSIHPPHAHPVTD